MAAMNKVIELICFAVLIYYGLMGFMYLYQRKMMYFPDTARLSPSAVGAQERVDVITVKTQDELELQGWYFAPSDQSKPVILWFHGNGSSHGHRSYRLEGYLDAGYGVLLAGYRGYGGNPGSPSEQGLYKDARAYVKWLQDRDKDIVLYGESLGTGVATHIATEFDVRALILEAPYSSTAEVAKETYFWLPVGFIMKDKFESLNEIADIDAPLLIIHGSEDEVIPIHFGERLFDFAVEPKTFVKIEGAAHYNLYERGAPLHVLEFLSTISEK